MTDRSAVMAEHYRNVGFREGANNDNPWGPEQGVGNHAAYCNSAHCMVAFHHGLNWWDGCTFGVRGNAYTVTHVQVARSHGVYVDDHYSKGSPAPLDIGDGALFDWNGSGSVDHIEVIAELPQGPLGNQFVTIGYNTGNPEGCWRVVRDRRYLHGVAKMAAFWTAAPAPAPPPPPPPPPHPAPSAPPFPLPAGSYFGPRSGPANSVSGYYSHSSDLARWQQRMKDRGWTIAVDGHFDAQDAQVATQFQAQKHLQVDGHVGPVTWVAAWTAPVT